MAKKNSSKSKPVAKAAPPAKSKLKAVAKVAPKAVAQKAPAKGTPAVSKVAQIKEKLKAKVEQVKKALKPTAAKPTSLKPIKKSADKVVEKSVKEAKEAKVSKKSGPKSMGSSLIEMAKEEMAAVKIGQTAEKVEKASKFKSIKVERGNLADEKAKWQEFYKRHGKDKAVNYKMTESFESLSPLQHKVLGWGFILTNDNDRLEVLFENGIKMLISNYKPN